MKLTTMVALVAVALLSACATVERAAYCTPEYRQFLAQEDVRLSRQGKELRTYSSSAMVPVSRIEGTTFTRLQYVENEVDSYAKAHYNLVIQAEKFNAVCTAP